MKSTIQGKALSPFNWEKPNMVQLNLDSEIVILLIINILNEETDKKSFNGLVLYSSHKDYDNGEIAYDQDRNKFTPYNGKIILEND